MCGIAGIFVSSGYSPRGETLAQMCAAIAHRGPEDQGVLTLPGIGFGHQRLKIIDVAGGHQPLSNEDGTIWVLLNGEIYNYLELRQELDQRGHRFRTQSDTEVIAHLYEDVGAGVFERLDGMFGLAIWDAKNKKLLLARDRVGKKPLYYAWVDGNLYFGSEMKAILAGTPISRDLDKEALSDYFSLGYIPSPKSIYKSVRKVRPAHYVEVTAARFSEREYWRLSFAEPERRSEQEWQEIMRAELFRATKARLMSEVPLGAFLSGGVDSSAVVAAMALQSDLPVTTCAVGFSAEQYDERKYAAIVASRFSTDHHEEVVTASAMDVIPRLAHHFDEPFADSSAVPTFFVCQAARRHVTVALGGDGGDENLAGYRRYRFDRRENIVRRVLPSRFRSAVFGALGSLYPGLGWAPQPLRAKATFQSLALSPIAGYFNSVSIFRPSELPLLFTRAFQESLRGYDSLSVLQQHYDRCDSEDPLSRIQYVDIKTYLPDDIMVKVDRTSMAVALEVRAPLLDHRLMETVARMPSTLKLRGGEGKYMLKRAMEKHLPREILYRRKQGFSMPVAEWFRSELKQFAMDRLFVQPDGIVEPRFVERIWQEHQRREFDRSAYLWSLLMYQEWKASTVAHTAIAEVM